MRKFSVVLAGLLMFVVPVTSEALTLSPEDKQKLTLLTVQLVNVTQQVSQARAQGEAYLNSPAFQQISASISATLVQIQAQLASIISGLRSQPLPVPGGGDANLYTCPVFFRDLEPSMYGDDVRGLQRFLASQPFLQFNGTITGVFDTATLAGVQRFQTQLGIGSFGNWNTTGFGRVGPRTRNAILQTCRPSVVPPVLVPVTPGPTPVQTSNASGNLTVERVPSNTKEMKFTVTTSPGSSCGSPSFMLLFGDNTQQAINFGYSCGFQSQTITHTYPALGSYTATLHGGPTSVSIPVVVAIPTHSLSLNAVRGAASFSVDLTLTHTPGARCEGGKYRVKWGNGAETDVTVPDSCSVQTRTTSYTYNGAGTYSIQVSDAWGNITLANFVAAPALSAGAGDPYVSTLLQGDGADGSTSIVDSSGYQRSWIAYGGAQLDTAKRAAGTASILFDGDAYVTTSAHDQFNYGTGPFTIDLWFSAASFPSSSGQASLIQQADSSARDSSLGGAGLVLMGDRLYFVGTVGGTTYHPFYNNSVRSAQLQTNTWYHAATVRNGNTITLYLNGVTQGSIVVSGAANTSTSNVALGRYGEFNGNYFNGWLDEVRITNGLARWTANFIPASIIDGGGGGAVSGNTILLLHGTTVTNGGSPTGGGPGTQIWDDGGALFGNSNTFVDSTGRHQVSAFGNAQSSTAQSKFGGSSILFDGNGDYASIPDSADWDFGTGDFTIDFWTNFTSVPDTDVFLDIGNGEGNAGGLRIIYFSAVSGIQVHNLSAGPRVFPWTPVTNTWYHIAIVRSAGVLRVFVNGSQIGSNQEYAQNLSGSTAGVKIGSWHSIGGYIPAYMDEIRIMKGTAAWTSNFTPPSAAY